MPIDRKLGNWIFASLGVLLIMMGDIALLRLNNLFLAAALGLVIMLTMRMIHFHAIQHGVTHGGLEKLKHIHIVLLILTGTIVVGVAHDFFTEKDIEIFDIAYMVILLYLRMHINKMVLCSRLVTE